MFVLCGVPVLPHSRPPNIPWGANRVWVYSGMFPPRPGLSQSHLIPVSPCPCPHIPPGGIPPWIPLGGPNPIPRFPPGSILHAGSRLHPRYPHRERGFCGRCRLPPRQDVPGDHCGNREWDGQRRGGRGGCSHPHPGAPVTSGGSESIPAAAPAERAGAGEQDQPQGQEQDLGEGREP